MSEIELEQPSRASAAGECLSCKASTEGAFCAACGQKNDDLRRSLLVLVREFVEDTFSFDSRMWRTLGSLVTKPGVAPNEYAHGRRSRYTPPVRLFLVVSFLFFLLLSVTQTLFVAITITAGDQNTEAKLTLLESDGGASAESDENLQCNLEASLLFFVRADEVGSDLDRWAQCLENIKAQIAAETAAAPNEKELEARTEARFLLENLASGVDAALEDPKTFNAGFNAWLPRVMLIMTPIAALILSIFIRGPDALFFDHLVLAFYGHAFGFFVVGVSVLLSVFGAPLAGFATVGVLLIYAGASLKAAYGRGWIKTIWTTLVGGAIYLVILLTMVVAIVWGIILQG